MSDTPFGPGWWMASDGKWYPPTEKPGEAPPGPGQYPVPGQYPNAYGYYPQPTTNSSATASLILGICSIACSLYILTGVPAIILGNKAKREINESHGSQGGAGLATAGIIMGWVAVGLTVLGVIFLVVLFVIASTASTTAT